jgi:hypothetical protein
MMLSTFKNPHKLSIAQFTVTIRVEKATPIKIKAEIDVSESEGCQCDGAGLCSPRNVPKGDWETCKI